MSLKRTSDAAGLPDRVDDAPCCWLCLEEGPDASGKPLIRNCSCKGSSGFAHLSCIINCAENMSRDAHERGEYPVDFFRTCPNCKQDYQDDIESMLADAQIDFVEREYKNNHLLYMDALIDKLYTLDFEDEQDRPEGDLICAKMLSIVKDVENDHSLQHYELAHSIAMAQHFMGEFHNQFGTYFKRNEYLEKANQHFKLAKDRYEVLGGEEITIMVIDRKIRKLNGTEAELDTAEEILFWRKRYNDIIMRYGENDIFTLDNGIELAETLHGADHTIEAERFLTTLVQKCRLVHGIEHNVTKDALSVREDIMLRKVFYLSTGSGVFQALRYVNDGERIILQGPLPECPDDERNADIEKTLTIDSKDVIPLKGTPVVVHSMRLRSVSHLNGKIGDIRAYSNDDGLFEVHFEEEGLGPTKVKLENVRILFGLPDAS
eukprot:scaffold9279_cov132-Skeletonema_dohrnii-CCMP3373.AAC.3